MNLPKIRILDLRDPTVIENERYDGTWPWIEGSAWSPREIVKMERAAKRRRVYYKPWHWHWLRILMAVGTVLEILFVVLVVAWAWTH